MASCRRLVRKHLTKLVATSLVLVTVRLTTLCYTSLTATSTAGPAGAWSRDAGESVVEVDAHGNFSERVARFNDQLQTLRRQMRATLAENDVDERTCRVLNWTTGGRPLRVVRGANDSYIEQLSDSPDIITVALPWLRSRTHWSSMTDFANVPYQRYFEWTADNVLCSWIETPRVIKMRYDSIYRRTCNRNITDTGRAQSLRPLFLNSKPIKPHYYWPNNGDAYPSHFYTTAPRYVFHMHIHRDAVVTWRGDVITAGTKLVLHACSRDFATTLTFGGHLSRVQCFDEVYVIAQYWGNGVFHRMAEIVPRLVPGLQFLSEHPQIRILAPQKGGRLAELLEIVGLNSSRLVTGLLRANIVYQPRSTTCGFANVQESQVLSQLYRDYIRRNLRPQPRNRLILIRRSRTRRFTEQRKIEKALERAASDYNLTYTLFIDNPTPSLHETMVLFHSAVVVVAPHGAGLSNLYFSQPGTYVVEGVCNIPFVNLCFLRLTHILGHHWHGVTSRRGCEGVVDVSATSVEDAVRNYLRLWKLERS